MSKPRVIKYFENLDDKTKAELLELYPYGFDRNLITFKNHKGELISALPYENEESIYMIRMSKKEAQEIYSDLEDMDLDVDGMEDDDDDDVAFDELDEDTVPFEEDTDD